MKEAHGNPRAYAVRGLEGGEVALASPLVAVVPTNTGGANQAGVRLYNERLLLSLVRRFGPLSKIEVARLTGLSVQSTSAIMNRLQADGLLKREAPLRGRVGQPTIPMSIDPEGAYSFGLRIGRRSCDLVLVDFRGAIRQRAHRAYAFPTPTMILDFVRDSLPSLANLLTATQKRRIAGLGVAAPFQLWSWESEIGAPPGAMDAWRNFDAESEIAAICPYPTTLCNDATAACAAEFFFGRCWRYRDFLYFFIGEFLGGGLVLDGVLRPGRTGNAAALGSMPIMAKRNGGLAPQLIACASIYQLERQLEAVGIDASSIWTTPESWAEFGAQLDGWIEDAASALAYGTVAAISVIDFEAIVIDGALPATVRERLTARTAEIFAGLDRRGLSDVDIVSGSIGADAGSIGGAALPLIKHFARDREVLFKDAMSRAS
ncbi:MAG TPA: ROK family transcriptional regulator [Roseiarcus sp.]|nr:ROK family transcriptional regulator [Roseiarcus sp.]